MGDYVNRLMAQLVAKNPGEPEFHQAVQEVAESVELALTPEPPVRRCEGLRADRSSRSAW
jgi:glutamate dehydrogenase (NADP+)